MEFWILVKEVGEWQREENVNAKYESDNFVLVFAKALVFKYANVLGLRGVNYHHMTCFLIL